MTVWHFPVLEAAHVHDGQQPFVKAAVRHRDLYVLTEHRVFALRVSVEREV